MPIINDGVWPFYDFTLHFQATLPSLGYRSFIVSPTADGQCNGGDFAATAASPTPASGSARLSKHSVLFKAAGHSGPDATRADEHRGFGAVTETVLREMTGMQRSNVLDQAMMTCYAEDRSAGECQRARSTLEARVAAVGDFDAPKKPAMIQLENRFLTV